MVHRTCSPHGLDLTFGQHVEICFWERYVLFAQSPHLGWIVFETGIKSGTTAPPERASPPHSHQNGRLRLLQDQPPPSPLEQAWLPARIGKGIPPQRAQPPPAPEQAPPPTLEEFKYNKHKIANKKTPPGSKPSARAQSSTGLATPEIATGAAVAGRGTVSTTLAAGDARAARGCAREGSGISSAPRGTGFLATMCLA